jgi:hypothetical protein
VEQTTQNLPALTLQGVASKRLKELSAVRGGTDDAEFTCSNSAGSCLKTTEGAISCPGRTLFHHGGSSEITFIMSP